MNATRHLLLALGLCVCVPAPVRAQFAPPGPMERAKTLSEQKQFAEAQKLLEDQLAQNPPQEQRTLLQNALADLQFAWGKQLEETKSYDQSLQHYQLAYESDKQSRPQLVGLDLRAIGLSHLALGHYEDALGVFNLTLPIYQQTKDRVGEAESLTKIGLAYRLLGRYEEELRVLNQALPIYQELKDGNGEMTTLDKMAMLNRILGHYEEALRLANQTLQLSRDLKNRTEEASILNDIGKTYNRLGRYEEALRVLNQALPMYREQKDQAGEAASLNAIGDVYSRLDHYEEALPFFNQALLIERTIKNRTQEVTSLNRIAEIYRHLGCYEESLRVLNQVLPICQELKDGRREAACLDGIGFAQIRLRHYEEALRVSNQSLLVHQRIKDRAGEATSFNILGSISSQLGRYEEALRFYQQSLAIYQELKNREEEASLLTSLGDIYNKVGRHQEAFDVSNQALAISQDLGAPEGKAYLLSNIGAIYNDSGHYEEALRTLNQALPIYEGVQDRRSEARCLYDISSVYYGQKQPQLAILYAKQAVNVVQSIRTDNQKLDKESQRSLLARNRYFYETLEAMLIEQNRLEEAEQVLRFLRQEDAFEFARRDPQLAREFATLFGPLTVTAAEKEQLPLNMAANVVLGKRVEESHLWQQALLQREQAGAGRVALISTFNTDDAFIVICTTAKERRAFSFPIKKSKFNVLCLRLQSKLTDPTQDPRPDAQKMYQIVFCRGQLEQALQKEGVTTALWFTSGSLRYIPIDALYDGKRYLVQKPRANTYVTLTSRTLFGAKTKGQALAVGVSQAHTIGSYTDDTKGFSFPRLSNVPKEVRSIVRDAKDKGTGPFSGKILLDKQFTAASLERALAQGASVVHVATHFFLGDGSDSNAFLLLGDGKPLPISQWKKALKLKGVGLLTLSACETGVGSPDATGGEVSSIGEVSQWLGAQSVIVSLWPVADSSTARLMSDFYTRLHNEPEQGKAQALRQAQCDLLGHAALAPSEKSERGRPFLEGPDVKDPAYPYAHPFYWAPFSLIGNWK